MNVYKCLPNLRFIAKLWHFNSLEKLKHSHSFIRQVFFVFYMWTWIQYKNKLSSPIKTPHTQHPICATCYTSHFQYIKQYTVSVHFFSKGYSIPSSIIQFQSRNRNWELMSLSDLNWMNITKISLICCCARFYF